MYRGYVSRFPIMSRGCTHLACTVSKHVEPIKSLHRCENQLRPASIRLPLSRKKRGNVNDLPDDFKRIAIDSAGISVNTTLPQQNAVCNDKNIARCRGFN